MRLWLTYGGGTYCDNKQLTVVGLHRAGVPGRGCGGLGGALSVTNVAATPSASARSSGFPGVLGWLGRGADVDLVYGEEGVTGPLTIGVLRVPTLDRFMDVELGQEESGARIAEPRVQAGTAPYRHVGA